MIRQLADHEPATLQRRDSLHPRVLVEEEAEGEEKESRKGNEPAQKCFFGGKVGCAAVWPD